MQYFASIPTDGTILHPPTQGPSQPPSQIFGWINQLPVVQPVASSTKLPSPFTLAPSGGGSESPSTSVSLIDPEKMVRGTHKPTSVIQVSSQPSLQQEDDMDIDLIKQPSNNPAFEPNIPNPVNEGTNSSGVLQLHGLLTVVAISLTAFAGSFCS